MWRRLVAFHAEEIGHIALKLLEHINELVQLLLRVAIFQDHSTQFHETLRAHLAAGRLALSDTLQVCPD